MLGVPLQNIIKENPRITIISNNSDSKAGVAFIINNDNIKENTENKWNYMSETCGAGAE